MKLCNFTGCVAFNALKYRPFNTSIYFAVSDFEIEQTNHCNIHNVWKIWEESFVQLKKTENLWWIELRLHDGSSHRVCINWSCWFDWFLIMIRLADPDRLKITLFSTGTIGNHAISTMLVWFPLQFVPLLLFGIPHVQRPSLAAIFGELWLGKRLACLATSPICLTMGWSKLLSWAW